MKRLLLTTLILMVGAGCASSTLVRTQNPDAEIWIDGKLRGHGQVLIRDRKLSFAATDVEIRKPGCRPQFHRFRRSERLDPVAVATGAWIIVPILWAFEYERYHSYHFNCEKAAAAPTNERAALMAALSFP